MISTSPFDLSADVGRQPATDAATTHQVFEFSSITSMHKHIPSSVKEQLVVMSSHMPSSCVARITGVNVRTVQQVIALAEQTGSVTRKPLQARKPRKLNALDVNVGSTMWHTFQCAVSHIYPVP